MQLSEYWSVYQRTRQTQTGLIEHFPFNYDIIMLIYVLEYRVGCHIILHQHCRPCHRFTLWTNDTAPCQFFPPLQYIIQCLYFFILRDQMQEKIIQDDQIKVDDWLQPFLVFWVVCFPENSEISRKFLTVIISYSGFAGCLCAKSLGQIGLSAVWDSEDTEIHTISQ